MWVTALREQCKVRLHPADFIEELQRVESFGKTAQLRFHLLGDRARGKQSRARRFWRVVTLDDP